MVEIPEKKWEKLSFVTLDMKEISPLGTKERGWEGWLQLGGHAWILLLLRIRKWSRFLLPAVVARMLEDSLRTCEKPRMRTIHLRGGSSSELKCLPGTLAPFLVDMTDAWLEQFKEGRIYLGSWLKGILSMRRGWGQHGWWGEGMWQGGLWANGWVERDSQWNVTHVLVGPGSSK